MMLVLGSALSVAFGVLEVPEEDVLSHHGTLRCDLHHCTGSTHLLSTGEPTTENQCTTCSYVSRRILNLCTCAGAAHHVRSTEHHCSVHCRTSSCTTHQCTGRYVGCRCQANSATLPHSAENNCNRCTTTGEANWSTTYRSQLPRTTVQNRFPSAHQHQCSRQATAPMQTPRAQPADSPARSLPLPDLLADLIPTTSRLARTSSSSLASNEMPADSASSPAARNIPSRASWSQSAPSPHPISVSLPVAIPSSLQVATGSILRRASPGIASAVGRTTGLRGTNAASTLREEVTTKTQLEAGHAASISSGFARNISPEKSQTIGNASRLNVLRGCSCPGESSQSSAITLDFLDSFSNASGNDKLHVLKYDEKCSKRETKASRHGMMERSSLNIENDFAARNEPDIVGVACTNPAFEYQQVKACSNPEDTEDLTENPENKFSDLEKQRPWLTTDVLKEGPARNRTSNCFDLARTHLAYSCDARVAKNLPFNASNNISYRSEGDVIEREIHRNTRGRSGGSEFNCKFLNISSFGNCDHGLGNRRLLQENKASANTRNLRINKSLGVNLGNKQDGLACYISCRYPVPHMIGSYGTIEDGPNKNAAVDECLDCDYYLSRLVEKQTLEFKNKVQLRKLNTSAGVVGTMSNSFNLARETGSYERKNVMVCSNRMQRRINQNFDQDKHWFSATDSLFCRCNNQVVRNKEKCYSRSSEFQERPNRLKGSDGDSAANAPNFVSHNDASEQKINCLKVVGAELRSIADDFGHSARRQQKVSEGGWLCLAQLNLRSLLALRLWNAAEANQLD